MRKGLGFHNRRSPGNYFTPAALFPSGTTGAWYDPSDSSTLFSDTAGTTPSPTPGAGALSVVGKMLDKSGNGNHAISYNTTTARPELSARVNLLTYSEQFDNAAWGKGGTTVNPNLIVAPDGTTTADLITVATTGSNRYVRRSPAGLLANVQFTWSVSAKQNTTNWLTLRFWDTPSGVAAWFNLATGAVGTTQAGCTASISDQGNGWYRCSITRTIGATISFNEIDCQVSSGNNTDNANAGDSIYLWGADLRPANIGASVPAYQRIADQYTYDSSGFPRYLVFNGTASGMYTPANLNLSGTDKATVFAGVRKQSDATAAVLTELSANFGSNNGALAVFAPSANTTADYYFGVTNTTTAKYAPTTYTSPISNVLSCAYDLSSSVLATQIIPKINGSVAQVNPSAGAASTGNFGTYPLYIGSRNNAGSWLNANLYSLIVVGAASTAAQISSTESWINVKEGTVY